ncbi:uncharacterized protein LOC144121936 isoform X1 [Amblyomma americanum]
MTESVPAGKFAHLCDTSVSFAKDLKGRRSKKATRGFQMDHGWTVAAAASLTAFFTVTMMMNSGFFYVSFMEEFDVNRETASWPASVMSGVSHSFGLLLSFCQRRLSVFHMGLAGSICLWAGILGAVFAPNMTWMTVKMGAVHGAGVGIVCVTLIIVVMMYFDKYRGIASGLKFAGYTLCSLVYPVILTSLKETYGVRGTLLVYAALTMNVTALTMLLKEPPWHKSGRKNNEKKPTASETDASPEEANGIATISSKTLPVQALSSGRPLQRPTYYSKYSKKPSLTPINDAIESNCSIGKPCKSSAGVYRETAPSGTPHLPPEAMSHATKTLHDQSSDARKPCPRNTDQTSMAHNSKKCFCGAASQQVGCCASNVDSPSVFRHIAQMLSKPRFYIVVLGIVALDYTVAVFPTTIVDYALDKGSARRHADLSVMYCAPAELVGRIALPLVGDCRVVSRTTLVSATFFLLAASMFALPVTSSFLSYILVCACATMLVGCLMSMKPVVIADYFGIQSVAASWGFAGVTLLPLLLCNPSIIGFFRDTMGSYDGLYQLQAAIHCCVGCLFGILSFLDRKTRKERAHKCRA